MLSIKQDATKKQVYSEVFSEIAGFLAWWLNINGIISPMASKSQ